MSRLDDLKKQLQEAESTIRDLKEKIRLSDIDALRKRFQESGYHEDGEAWDYVRALEKCRPWVIRDRQSGGLWLDCIGGFVSSVSFLSKHDADEFLDKEIMQKSEWEVVQWEGEE